MQKFLKVVIPFSALLIFVAVIFLYTNTVPEEIVSMEPFVLGPQYAYDTIQNWSCNLCLHVVDVRNVENYSQNRIYYNNTKVTNITNIPYSNSDHLSKMLYYDMDVNKFGPLNDSYILYCEDDSKSYLFSKEMINYGFKNVYFIPGGFNSWVEMGLPIGE